MFALPLLAALTGCITGSTWPHYDGLGGPLDTGTDTVPYTAPNLPCNRPDEGTVAQLTVQNPSPNGYQLSQMTDLCEEQFVTVVTSNDAFVTSVGNHVQWVVRDLDGVYVRGFGVPSGSGVQWVEILP